MSNFAQTPISPRVQGAPKREFASQGRSFRMTTPHQFRARAVDGPIVAEDEGHILACLGAAVIMRWNTLPTKLQKELFDDASSTGELLQSDALKGEIARFLHNHKDDEAAPKT
jgi:hypothetical protein